MQSAFRNWYYMVNFIPIWTIYINFFYQFHISVFWGLVASSHIVGHRIESLLSFPFKFSHFFTQTKTFTGTIFVGWFFSFRSTMQTFWCWIAMSSIVNIIMSCAARMRTEFGIGSFFVAFYAIYRHCWHSSLVLEGWMLVTSRTHFIYMKKSPFGSLAQLVRAPGF